MRTLLLVVLVLTVSGFSSCDWPWDKNDDDSLAANAQRAADQTAQKVGP